MHKCMSPHGDYDHMGEAINLVNYFENKFVIEYRSDERIAVREYELV